MADLTFTGAILRSFERSVKNAGRAKFSAQLTQSVIKAMSWSDIPECLTGANLEGSLSATNADLQPTDPVLAKSGFTIDANLVDGFQSVRRELEGKQGKGYRSELHFVVHFADPNGCAKLEQYMEVCGSVKAKLSINYSKQANLPGTEDTDADSGKD